MPTDATNPEFADAGAGDDRRAFLKRMAAVGFAVPVVASFSMLSSTPAFAQTLCSGGVSDSGGGNLGGGGNLLMKPGYCGNVT